MKHQVALHRDSNMSNKVTAIKENMKILLGRMTSHLLREGSCKRADIVEKRVCSVCP